VIALARGSATTRRCLADELAKSRPLRMYREGLSSILYRGAVENRRPAKSDLRDLHHAVASSVTAVLVTANRGFQEWCRRVALPEFEVCLFEEFIDRLEPRTEAPQPL
jgi:hypothetical protein